MSSITSTKTATFRKHDGVWALQGTDLVPGDLVEVHKRGGEVVTRYVGTVLSTEGVVVTARVTSESEAKNARWKGVDGVERFRTEYEMDWAQGSVYRHSAWDRARNERVARAVVVLDTATETRRDYDEDDAWATVYCYWVRAATDEEAASLLEAEAETARLHEAEHRRAHAEQELEDAARKGGPLDALPVGWVEKIEISEADLRNGTEYAEYDDAFIYPNGDVVHSNYNAGMLRKTYRLAPGMAETARRAARKRFDATGQPIPLDDADLTAAVQQEEKA